MISLASKFSTSLLTRVNVYTMMIDMDGNDGLTGNEVTCRHCGERVVEEDSTAVPGEGSLCLACFGDFMEEAREELTVPGVRLGVLEESKEGA